MGLQNKYVFNAVDYEESIRNTLGLTKRKEASANVQQRDTVHNPEGIRHLVKYPSDSRSEQAQYHLCSITWRLGV